MDQYLIGIRGAACRLPGAANEAAFQVVLNEGLSTVSQVPPPRWHSELLYHPDNFARGSSYSFAGGYIDSPYDFDIGVFGMSPREAEQVDPQQRLLAELVWEALEDARLPADAIAGKNVGVYIGASALDHANLFGGDPGAIQSHFMTGNTLSIVANRISYLFDLKGPSFVVDTACSSSLVAVDRALADLQSGRVEIAVVGGVNMLMSPAAFVGFSQAQMLSPTGACRPFSNNADGYVRSEGGVVFVLEPADAAPKGALRALIMGSAVNSDGKTSGIALPSLDGQRSLLDLAYNDVGVSPNDLAFVEAHGTGTAVGDPIEAMAIGQALGQRRNAPLPIGSVKSNIGHLEPASGVAGMMKALIALEQSVLPRTINLDTLNPDIEFERLNLVPASRPVPLEGDELYCGVSSFGFGGTNAHVVMRNVVPAVKMFDLEHAPERLVISAQCQESLAALASAYAMRLEQGADPGHLARATESGRSLMRHRAVLPATDSAGLAASLRALAKGKMPPIDGAPIGVGVALPADARVCFVYNGNGSQWAGMGRDAYAANAAFRAGFDEANAAFSKLGFGCLVDLMHADDLADQLAKAAVSQPLIFAVQRGIARALARAGLEPSFVIGHSVGEIAAAHAAGALSLTDAVRVIAARAKSQEAVFGVGGMAAVGVSRSQTAQLIEAFGMPDLGIAADNSPTTVTISGSGSALGGFLKYCRKQRVVARKLAIEYPYHSQLLDPIQEEFRQVLGAVEPKAAAIAMISSVTGELLGETQLDEAYWWRNLREEVQFRKAVRCAAQQGANLFVEIGPNVVLTSAIEAELEASGHVGRVLETLTSSKKLRPVGDPFAAVALCADANGHRSGQSLPAAPFVDRSVDLPTYPWQRKTFAYSPSSAAIDLHGIEARHPLIGGRLAQGVPEWRTTLDPVRVPYLADHVVGGEVIVPATALAEMALAAAREIWPGSPVRVEDFDILQPLVLPDASQVEISVRFSQVASAIEIYSRPRFASDEWSLHARGFVSVASDPVRPGPRIVDESHAHEDAEAIYRAASESDIEYGDAFRLLLSMRREGKELFEANLALPPQGQDRFSKPHVLHPASLDAAFHALFDLVAEDDGAIKTWLPIRFERLSVWKANAHVTSASLRVDENGDKLKIVSLWLFDADGELVARLDRALLKAVVHAWVSANRGVYHLSHQPAGRIGDETLFGRVHRYFEEHDLPVVSDAWNLMEAHRQAALHEALLTRSDDDGRIDLPNDTKVDTIISAQIDGVIDSALRSGILRRADGVLTLDEDIQHPSAEIILASVLAEFPEAAVDVGLSAQMAADLPRLLAGEQVPLPRVALLQQYETSSLRYAPIKKAIAGCLAAISAEIEDPIHIVVDAQHGMAAASELLSHAARGTIRLSLVAEDSSVAQRIANRLPVRPETEIIDLSKANTPCADIVFAFGVEVSSPAEGQMSALSRLLVPGGVLVTLAYPVDDLVTFHRGCAVREQVMHPAFHSDTPENVANIENHASFGDAMSGLSVRIAQRRAVVGRTVRVCALGGNSCGIITELCGAGIDAAAFSENEVPDDPFDLVWFADDGELALNALIMDLQAKLLGPARNSGATRIWVVARGSGVSGALRGFARVAMNEMADIDLRFIELADGVGLDMAALALAMLASESSVEREWRLTHVGLEVPRLQRGLSLTKVVEGGADHALRLNFPRPGMLEHFDWVSGERTAPGYGEVELEVIATGLNFRDVMLAMGMLDDDVLEAGLAGSVFGLECAGRVVRLGTGVTRLSEGDVVVGFAQSCFTSHVVASEHSLVLVPDGMPPEAAAGLPVPFLTAWYALEELARIKPGETVLVHGGAGAVGLAAIQIARDLGVTVIATVSSPDKEALARLFGAQFVYNSRTLEFVDQVRENHGGVDAVLNSLAGDAMRGGIKCLRSRGRFIELGKRDYVANSLIPLRAFRRNLSYFGVDIDQVLDLEPSVAKRGIEAVFEAIKEERYLPLPVNVHEPNQISQAFRLMQASGHVGKIVIKAPDSGRGEEGKDTAFDPGGGVQLVVGGTRGFGLATALWLAEKGAEKIVVASRSGKLDPDYADRVDALRRDGIVFDVASLDVGDASAVQELINDIVSQYGPITGVWNTAVSLHDAMIESLEEAKVDQVLEAKVSGSEILHLATLDQPLEQFVLFSSVSALIGNPGQGAYAAANGYMEGLVCRRRAEGRPALAIEWGAILDVGLLADNVETMESLARFSGVSGLTSNEALARLEAVLVKTQRLSDPVVALCDFSVNGGLRGLPVAISPAFAGLLANGSSSAGGEHKSLAEQIVGKSEAEAQRIILDILAREVAKIMRLAVEDVNLDESIDNLGMDSLMAVELRMTIENVCAIELSMMAISAVSNLRELANRILRLVSGSEAGNEEQPLTAVETELLATHGGTTSHVE